ncbi:MAG: peptidylprolyl isomerase [Acidobacteriota bacterium]|nr:peptidylprolyl isomerase [Acidobacteriota bacterium]
MMTRALALSLVLSCTALAQSSSQSADALPDAPGAPAPAQQTVVPTGPTVLLDTTLGRLTCKLYDQQAPQTVANFIGLAEGTKDWTDPATQKKMHNKPLYNGTTFHRVIPGFMIQGGDPMGTGMGDPGYYFDDEFSPDLAFDVPGRLAMANSGPNTNGSQFFITEVPVPELNHKHTIFGQCDQHSVQLVAAIARVDRDGQDKPTTPVVINRVTIVRDGQPIPPEPAGTAAAKAPPLPPATPPTK